MDPAVDAAPAVPEAPPAAAPAPAVPLPEFYRDEGERTPEGALAFASYFVRVLEHASLANDSSLLRSVSLENCTHCLDEAGDEDEDAARGEVSDGLRLLFREATLHSYDAEAGTADLDLTYGWPAWRLRDSSGELLEEVEAVEKHHTRLYLMWVEGQWKVHWFGPAE
ncbi:hypothetical protein CLV92_1097 [Kineococcus xinjiangensis]|uniref:DUF6318 domain-containing protein n=1 Tax=Kineococcus xinjiangensis TaxID=512762 RepID=A0A2S6IHR3_9ACTN|nr:hypothetical protein CLV92_1097 [Kineococcus xinjiangensis]